MRRRALRGTAALLQAATALAMAAPSPSAPHSRPPETHSASPAPSASRSPRPAESFSPHPAASVSPRPSGSPGQPRLQDLQREGDRAIDARLSELGDLDRRLRAAGGLTAADRGRLEAGVTADRSGLGQLRAKLDAETGARAAAADVQEIARAYRVFALLQPQVLLAIADDTLIGVCSGELTQIEQRLGALVSARPAGDAGARLTDLKAQLATACSDATSVHGEIMALSAAGWPGNRPALDDARSKLGAALAALHRAIADARAIEADLRASSPRPTISPTAPR